MRAASHKRQQRGYVLVLVLVASFMVMTFAVLMGRLAVLEFGRERQAQVAACAGQLMASARAWSRVHADEIPRDKPVGLLIDDLLPAGVSGAVELRRLAAPGGEGVIACQVTLERAGRRLTRRAQWSAPTEPARATEP